MRRTLPEKTIGHCSKCGRWQYLYQPSFFEEFSEGVFLHLPCIECHSGAWCRDIELQSAEHNECAYRAHKHPIGQCRPRV